MAEKKKSAKAGRNDDGCESYRRADKHALSHVRRAWRHVQRYGASDHMAVHFLNNSNWELRRRCGVPVSITPEPAKRTRKSAHGMWKRPKGEPRNRPYKQPHRRHVMMFFPNTRYFAKEKTDGADS